LNRPRRPRGWVEVLLYSFFNLGARWGWVVNAMPRPLYPWERPGNHCIGGWVGPRVSLDGCEKSRLTLGFDPRTVQPVVIRYTDWAILACTFLPLSEYKTYTRTTIPIQNMYTFTTVTTHHYRNTKHAHFYHCHNTKHIHAPLSQYKICILLPLSQHTTIAIQNMYTFTTVTIQNIYTHHYRNIKHVHFYHCHNTKHIHAPLSQYKTCTLLPLSQYKTYTRTTIAI